MHQLQRTIAAIRPPDGSAHRAALQRLAEGRPGSGFLNPAAALPPLAGS